MKRMKRLVLNILIVTTIPLLLSFLPDENPGNDNEASVQMQSYMKSSRLLEANNISTWFSNDGEFNRNPSSGNSGFQWPKGFHTYARYASGLWIGAKVGDDTLIAVSQYDSEYLPGYVDDSGNPNGKEDPAFRIYSFGGNITLSSDYGKWPFQQGAYADKTGKPFMMGDQTMFYSYTDGYPESHNVNSGTTEPLKAQILQTNWSYKGDNLYGVLGNTVFTEYRIINRSGRQWKNFHAGLWSDDDLGDANDDAVGSDSLLDMVYMYNFDNNDPNYGTAPPAVAFQILRGMDVPGEGDTAVFFDPPTSGNLRIIPGRKLSRSLAALCVYKYHPLYGEPSDFRNTYRLLQGKGIGDTFWVNPQNGNITRYSFSGDPESNTGWLSNFSGDNRLIICNGPADLNPNDTQKIITAQLIARGGNNRISVSILKYYAACIRRFYESDFTSIKGKIPGAPGYRISSLEDGSAYFILEDSLERVRIPHSLSGGEYKFQGYNIYQIRSYSQTPVREDTVLRKTYDLSDGISVIMDSIFLPDHNSVTYKVVQRGYNSGILHNFAINRDTFTSSPFMTGMEYTFAIEGYFVDLSGGLLTDPKVLYTPKKTVNFVPQPMATGTVSGYEIMQRLPTDQKDAGVYPFVLEPLKLISAEYRVVCYPEVSGLRLSLLRENASAVDTLYSKELYNSNAEFPVSVTDGFVIKIGNIGDSGLVRDGVIKSGYPVLNYDTVRSWEYYPKGQEWFTGPDQEAVKTAKIFTNRQFESRSLGMSFPSTSTFRALHTFVKANGSYFRPVYSTAKILTGGPLRKILIRFGDSFSSNAYRYLPADTNYTNTPFAGFVRVPFSVFAIDELDSTSGSPRRLNIGFMDADNSRSWNPKGGDQSKFEKLGGYEITYIMASTYDSLEIDEYADKNPGKGNEYNGFTQMDIMYVWLPRAKFAGGILKKWNDGDELRVWPERIIRKDFVPGFQVAYEFHTQGAESANREAVLAGLNRINIFPNPYYGFSELEYNSTGEKFVYVSNLPAKADIRIYSLDGVIVRKILRNELTVESSLEKWDLRNQNGEYVSSGIYILYVDCPGIGNKTLKAAIIMSK